MRLWSCIALVAFLPGCGNKTLKMMQPGSGNDLSVQLDMGHEDLAGENDGGPVGPPDLSFGDLSFSDAAVVTEVSGGPMITLVSPIATVNDVVGNNLDVVATVTSSSTITSVTFTIPEDMTVTTMSPNGANFEGTRDISKVGPVGQFTITAVDANNKQGTLTAYYRHDRGPIITFVQPSTATAHGSAPVRVTVQDELYPTINPANVSATVQNVNIPLTAVPSSNPLQLYGTITFSDFTPILDGTQFINVTASNVKGTTSTASKEFTVDNEGPTIVINTPVAGDFAGGIVAISATITDESGVNDATVVTVFGGEQNFQVSLVPDPTTPNNYIGQFDIRQLGTDYVLPTVSVRADDIFGNHGELAEIILVDNTPPILAMDPARIRVEQLDQSTEQLECSDLFDPLGDETADDGEVVSQLVTLKARIEDRGNTAGGQLVTYVAGIDPTTTRIVIIPAPTGSEILAVDTDGDGICDDVNPNLIPTSGEAASSNQSIQLPLTQITTVGAGNFFFTGSQPSPEPNGCQTIGDPTVTEPPPLLCPYAGTDLVYTLQYLENSTPAIWTLPPVADTGDGCIGLQFDTENRLPEGPACVVAVATDNTQNTNVSTPLRICIDRGTPGVCSAWSLATAPNCTGTYDKASMTASNTPCTPLTFPASGEVHSLDGSE